MIKDDNFFTNKEYEELMASSIRKQSFDAVAPVSATLDEVLHELIEGKDDYFTTDDNSPDSDYAFLNGRYSLYERNGIKLHLIEPVRSVLSRNVWGCCPLP